MGMANGHGYFNHAIYLGVSLSMFIATTSPVLAQNTPNPFAPETMAPTLPGAAPEAPAPRAPVTIEKTKEPVRPAPRRAPAKPVVETQEILSPPVSPTPVEAQPVVAPTPAPPIAPVIPTTSTPTPIPTAPAESAYNVAPNPQTTDPFAPSYVVSSQPVPVPSSVNVPAVPTPIETENVVAASTLQQEQAPTIIENALPPEEETTFFERLGNLFKPTSQTKETVAPIAETTTDPANNPSFLEKIGNFFSSSPEQSVIQDETPAPPVQEKTKPTTTKETSPAPDTSAKTGDDSNLFEKIGDFLKRPIETEKAVPSIANPSPHAETTPSSTSQAVNTPPAAPDPRLLKAELGLGRDIKLGQGDDDLAKDAKCFTKNRGTIAFCTTPTRWPDPIARYFDASTHLYKGVRAIVQYDGSIATRLYSVFKSDGFNEVVAYYENLYGPATNTFTRTTRLLKETVENKSYIWRKTNTTEGLVEVMEIRQISDMRGPNPDLEHSTLRVYFEGSRAIFSQVSDLDFMHLR